MRGCSGWPRRGGDFAQDLLSCGRRFVVQGKGRLLVPHFIVQGGKVVQAGGVVGVPLPQSLFVDRQRLLEEGQGGLVVPHVLVQVGKVVHAGRVGGVPLAQRLLL